MAEEGAWGTDIEIFTACSLLSTDVYVYRKVGQCFKWQKFSCTMLNGKSPNYNRAIYLQQTNGVHYDVVLNVSAISNDRTLSFEASFPETRVFSRENQLKMSLNSKQKEAVTEQHNLDCDKTSNEIGFASQSSI